MRVANIFRLRLRSLLRRKQVEQELDEELRYHLERQMEEGINAGLTPQDARYAALRSITDVEQRKEECRDMRGLNIIDNAVQDFRYTVRQLRKNPLFALTAIFVLALGISATVAIFAFVDAALIQPLPYRDQSRVVMVFESSSGYARSLVSYQDFADWKRLNKVFRSIDAYALNGGFTLNTAEGAEQVRGTRISAGFFRTLGVVPALGRDFRTGEDSPGAARTVILSYGAWQKRFGGARDVLGKTLALGGSPTIVIGVLPRSFEFAPYGRAEFWGTLRPSDNCEQRRECHNLFTIARLKDGVSAASASADMQSIARELQRQYPDSNRDFGDVNVVALRDVIVGDVRPILLVMLSGAGLLLVIACLNVMTLLLARSDKRRREFGVRGALGASSSRLFQQFAMEGLVLAVMGGGLGLVFADVGMRLLAGVMLAGDMDSMPYLRDLGLNFPTTRFACSLTLLAGLIFALVPIAGTFVSGISDSLKEGERGSAGTTWRRFGSKLVVIEVAMAMVVMVSAGLLGKSLYLLLHVDIGFRADDLALVQTGWPATSYANDQQKTALGRQIVDRISLLPGVKSVAISNAPPVNSAWGTASFHVVGRTNHGEHNEVLNRQVSSGYFATLQARVLRGRYFREDEGASKAPVVVVNRTLANKYFPGEDPVGKQIYYDWRPESLMQIVGIVEDIKEGPLEGATMPAVYVLFDQNPVAWPAVLVRTSQDGKTMLPKLVGAIHGLDPFIAVSGEETMTERINQSPSAFLHRSSALLAGLFAVTAFLLAVGGLYGVVAYSVSQRTREIGVRMALGADSSTVYQLILTEAGRLTVFGVVVGVACSFGATTLLGSLLFGVGSWDVPTLASVAAVLGISALAASYIPARRAAAVNPVEALRAE